MRRLELIFIIIGTILLVSSFANAQVPRLDPIPESLSGPQREELTSRRSQLEAQWTALESKVKSHNPKCDKVPVNTPLANECRQAQTALNSEIAAFIQAVKSFNQTVEQAATAPQQTVPSPSPQTVSSFVSERYEIELGDRVSTERDSQMTLVTDRQGINYVQGVGNRLASVSTPPGIEYKVRICNDCGIPQCSFACSILGGHIYINGALIRRLDNEAELGAILAHEVAHIAARHQVQNLSDHLRAAGTSVLLAGPLGPLIHSAVFTKFERDQEREADRLAVEILYKAGIRPTALITSFKKLKHPTSTGVLETARNIYFASHPSEKERIQNLEPLLADPRFNQIREFDSPEFRAVRNRLTSP